MEQETEESPNSDSKVEDLHSRTKAALRESLEEQWEEVLDQWSGGEASERKAVWTYVSNLRERVLDSLLAIDSLEALKRGLAIGYVEMKCHWTMLNTQIQHQTVQNGRPAEPLLYRATCVSLIVQVLEPLVSREYVEGLVDLLAEPLA